MDKTSPTIGMLLIFDNCFCKRIERLYWPATIRILLNRDSAVLSLIICCFVGSWMALTTLITRGFPNTMLSEAGDKEVL